MPLVPFTAAAVAGWLVGWVCRSPVITVPSLQATEPLGSLTVVGGEGVLLLWVVVSGVVSRIKRSSVWEIRRG